MKKLLLVLVILAALAGGAYYLFFANKSTPNVSVTFEKPDEVLVGQPFDLKINYSNNSQYLLKNTQLSVSLPDNVSILGDSQSHKVDEIQLGDVSPNSVGSQDVQLIILGDPQTVKRIQTKLVYSLEGSSSQFENDDKVDVVIGASAISLNIETPDKVVSGENFQITINYKNNTGDDYKNVRIVLDYPPAYAFATSSPLPTTGKNQWDLNTVASSSEGSIVIQGKALGQEGLSLNYGINFIAQFNGQDYTLQNQTVAFNLSQPSLSLSITPDGNANYIAKAGDGLHYVLAYKNNSGSTLQNISIKAVLSGGMYDMSSLRTDGSLNSITNTISWNPSSNSNLISLSPGQTGTAEFDVNILPNFPIKRINDKNYTLKIQATIQSPTVPSGINASQTISAASLETKIQGQVQLSSQAFRYDTSLGTQNTGPYPPKVNQPTQYTVHWKITNYSTDISSVHVVAVLKSGTLWTGKISKTDNPPVYDAGTGKITWDIPKIPATVGVLGDPLEVDFQLQNTPAVNQIGQNVDLLSNTDLSAKDEFTGVGLSDDEPGLTTSIPNDTKVTVDNRTVQQ